MITIRRPSTTKYLIEVPIENGAAGDVAEWDLSDIGGGRWCIGGLRVLDTGNVRAPIVLADASSVFEYAIQLGAVSGHNGGFYGGAHGFETTEAVSLELDGAALALSVSSFTTGSKLVVKQSRTIQLPPLGGSGEAGATVGTSSVSHRFSDVGLKCKHSHNYNAGHEIVDTAYGHMLPTVQGAFDRLSIGNGAEISLVGDDGVKGNAQAKSGTFRHTSSHAFQLTLDMPTGGPVTGGYSHAELNQMFVHDRAPSNGAKLYACYVSLLFDGVTRGRRPATPTAHACWYKVSRSQ